jgi:hypothetical protein
LKRLVISATGPGCSKRVASRMSQLSLVAMD